MTTAALSPSPGAVDRLTTSARRASSSASAVKEPAIITDSASAAMSASANDPTTPLSGSPTAVQRLESSRQKIRAAMTPPARSASRTADGVPLTDKLRRIPGLDVVVDALRAWWAQHPLRPVVQVMAEASNAAAHPLVDEKPMLMVGAAALAGAVLAWIAPWRWLLRSALFAGLVPQLASRLVTKLPIESWVAMLTSALKSKSYPADPAPSKSAAPPAF